MRVRQNAFLKVEVGEMPKLVTEPPMALNGRNRHVGLPQPATFAARNLEGRARFQLCTPAVNCALWGASVYAPSPSSCIWWASALGKLLYALCSASRHVTVLCGHIHIPHACVDTRGGRTS